METLDRCGGPVGEVGRGDTEVGVRQQWRCGGASDEDVRGEDKKKWRASGQ